MLLPDRIVPLLIELSFFKKKRKENLHVVDMDFSVKEIIIV